MPYLWMKPSQSLEHNLVETLSKACGVKKAGKGPVKEALWWNDNVQEVIKGKEVV